MRNEKRILATLIIAVIVVVALVVTVAYTNEPKNANGAETTTSATTTTSISQRQEVERLRQEIMELRISRHTIEPKATTEETETETEESELIVEAEVEADYEAEQEDYEETAEYSNYIGEFRITYYSAEELIRSGYGSPDGHTTASGTWATQWHTVAMNYDQRRALGISYGTQIMIEGFDCIFVVEDCGCSWGTIDMFFEYNQSDWNNPYRDVWIVS